MRLLGNSFTKNGCREKGSYPSAGGDKEEGGPGLQDGPLLCDVSVPSLIPTLTIMNGVSERYYEVEWFQTA